MDYAATIDLNQVSDPRIPKQLVQELGQFAHWIQQSVQGKLIHNKYMLYVSAIQNDCCECCHKRAQIFTELEIVHPTFIMKWSETISKVAQGEIVLDQPDPVRMPKKNHHGSGKDVEMDPLF